MVPILIPIVLVSRAGGVGAVAVRTERQGLTVVSSICLTVSFLARVVLTTSVRLILGSLVDLLPNFFLPLKLFQESTQRRLIRGLLDITLQGRVEVLPSPADSPI